MKKYIVKYHEVIIGTYTIVDNDNVEYIINEKGIEKLKEQGFDIYPDLVKNFSGKSFPLFDNRIKNCSRFDDKVYGYHTDPISIELIQKN